jgi:hypothetical protein
MEFWRRFIHHGTTVLLSASFLVPFLRLALRDLLRGDFLDRKGVLDLLDFLDFPDFLDFLGDCLADFPGNCLLFLLP